ncbi:hypothetical protein Rhe02_37650 [Rhizocola hellebori]|uniref:Uncharacterized protein n=1 Tax=Rhizocola hellebori TaxID=1392758 RepID=A0A8J3VH98_9ACTN|nr:hypothetical protein [Rhizocola hellebori]GIH05698.1 hypothetical protein Rhe02_37650 [Rhizocola hellebori]
MSNDSNAHRALSPDPAAGDMSHLRPDRLRLGSVGVFAGNWAWTGDPPRIPVGFVGTLIGRWNGWAVFRCTREVAQAIVGDQERMRAAERTRLTAAGITDAELDRRIDERLAPMWFEGDELICDETATYGQDALQRHSPGEDGRYCVQGFTWCWSAVDPADCDRIAGVLPAFGEHQEFVIAAHQPLRMPHDRLTVTCIRHLELSTGVAYSATLCLDGQPVGTADNTGTGGPTVFQSTDPRFSQSDMDRFVDGCRWRGREVCEEFVLETLITEYELDIQITAAATRGLAVVVLRDSQAQVVSTEYRLDSNRLSSRDLRGLAEKLTADEAANYPYLTQFVWQVWIGTGWKLIGIVDPTRNDGRPGGR